MSIKPPICEWCKHLNRDPESTDYTCKAFPGGIPEAIVLSMVDHRKPIEGDHGTQFTQRKGPKLPQDLIDSLPKENPERLPQPPQDLDV